MLVRAASLRSDVYLAQMLQLLSVIKVEHTDDIIRRAIRLVDEKGIPINHILAELLIYYYLRDRGYSYVSIEESVGVAQCDVYARREEFDVCVEIDFYSVPLDFLLSRTRYILARHVRKALQVVKSGIKAAIFAYPYGYIPLVPIELVRSIDSRSKKRIFDLATRIREIAPLENDDIDHLMKVYIHSVLIFDIDSGKVYELSPQEVEGLAELYGNYVGET
ncbi:MAG: hypothetical protein N3D82_00040 [Ignisphaera sp.]|nr:hypothetical protein [Ignisphaera sp.]MCX8167406.1 hypothetical protein [Ignisphaera sp.]MDW8085938.1 hypothetical protein [Ignisphaera sp.]